jgi:heptosyltransferase-1
MHIKVLIVKTSALGDIVHVFPAIEFLREALGDVEIDWAVERRAASLVEAYPNISEVFILNTSSWKRAPWKARREIRNFITLLRAKKYDIVFDFQGNSKSALITALARSDKKVGFGRKSVTEWPNLLVTDSQFDPLPGSTIYERNLFLVRQLLEDDSPWTFTPFSLIDQQPSPIGQHNVNQGRRYMICFGSCWENKKLPPSLWRSLIESIAGQGNALYLIYGTEEERKEAESLQAGIPLVSILEKMSLPLLQKTMALMDGVISVDSIALHLARIAGVPTFGLFGPSSATVFSPEGVDSVTIQGSCPYGVKFDKRCSELRRCSTGACLKELSISVIWARFLEWQAKCRNLHVPPQA